MENERGYAPRAMSGLAQRLKEDGRQTLEERKRSAAERVDEIAQAIERAGAQFSQNEPTLADYANRVAATVGNLATRLREGSVDDLIEDTRQFARRNPGLFIAGGVAAGFALSRFVKASAEHPDAGGERAPILTEEITQDATTPADSTLDPGVRSFSEEAARSKGA